MIRMLKKLYSSHEGATAVEYGLIASLVVIAAMGAMINLGGSTINMWNTVSNEVVESSS